MDLSRRDFITRVAAGAAAGLFVGHRAAFADCALTPKQDLGPFHPTRRMSGRGGEDGLVHGIPGADLRRVQHADADNNLTRVRGRSDEADLGQVGYYVYLYGLVKDADCNPVPDADVEIWQACVTGRYNHRQQVSRDRFDPNFQYSGRTRTNQNGAFIFKTVQPGAYMNDPTWIRPPHIHCIVGAPRFEELTTQFYFAGTGLQFGERAYGADATDYLNRADNVLRRWVRNDQRSQVISSVEPGERFGFERNSRLVRYEVVLERPASTSASRGPRRATGLEDRLGGELGGQ